MHIRDAVIRGPFRRVRQTRPGRNGRSLTPIQLRWFQDNRPGAANDRTIIEGDVNGNRVADFQIQLTGLKTLTAADFVL